MGTKSKKPAAEAPAEKAAAHARKAAAVPADLSTHEIKGFVFVVEFDHTFEDSEAVMVPNKEGKLQYSGHDKTVKTTVHHVREYPNEQLAQSIADKAKNEPEAGISNVKISKKKA